MNKDFPVGSTTGVEMVVGTEITAVSSFQKYQGLWSQKQHLCGMCAGFLSPASKRALASTNGNKYTAQTSGAKMEISTFLST